MVLRLVIEGLEPLLVNPGILGGVKTIREVRLMLFYLQNTFVNASRQNVSSCVVGGWRNRYVVYCSNLNLPFLSRCHS